MPPTLFGVQSSFRGFQLLQPRLNFIRVQWHGVLPPLSSNDLELALVPTTSGVTDWHTFLRVTVCHPVQGNCFRCRFLDSENPISDGFGGFLSFGFCGVLF